METYFANINFGSWIVYRHKKTKSINWEIDSCSLQPLWRLKTNDWGGLKEPFWCAAVLLTFIEHHTAVIELSALLQSISPLKNNLTFAWWNQITSEGKFPSPQKYLN